MYIYIKEKYINYVNKNYTFKNLKSVVSNTENYGTANGAALPFGTMHPIYRTDGPLLPR